MSEQRKNRLEKSMVSVWCPMIIGLVRWSNPMWKSNAAIGEIDTWRCGVWFQDTT